jgi:P-type Cu+ transporter
MAAADPYIVLAGGSFSSASGLLARPTRTTMAITGMTCSACVASLEKVLAAVPGVRTAAVSLLTETGMVQHEVSVAASDLVRAVEDAGFAAHVVSECELPTGSVVDNVSFSVERSEGACADFEELLAQLPGVITATLDQPVSMVRLDYDGEKTGVRDLKAAVKLLGCDVTVCRNESPLVALREQRARETKMRGAPVSVAVAFALPCALFAMVFPHIPVLGPDLETQLVNSLTVNAIIMFVLATPVQFYVGHGFYKGAYNLRHRSATMDVLVAGGTSIAYFYSVITLVFAAATVGISPEYYFEVSALLMAFVVFGKWLESVAKEKTSEALTKLLDLQPATVVLVHPAPTCSKGALHVDSETEIDMMLLHRGDTVSSRSCPGQRSLWTATLCKGRRQLTKVLSRANQCPFRRSRGAPSSAER